MLLGNITVTSSKLFSMCVSVGMGVCMHACVCVSHIFFLCRVCVCVNHIFFLCPMCAHVCVYVCVLITSFFLSPFSGGWVVDRKDTIKELPVWKHFSCVRVSYFRLPWHRHLTVKSTSVVVCLCLAFYWHYLCSVAGHGWTPSWRRGVPSPLSPSEEVDTWSVQYTKKKKSASARFLRRKKEEKRRRDLCVEISLGWLAWIKNFFFNHAYLCNTISPQLLFSCSLLSYWLRLHVLSR